MVTNYEGDNIELKNHLPLLPIREIVIYPFMIFPFFIGRESSIQAVKHSKSKCDRLVMLLTQKDMKNETPSPSDLFEVGMIAIIMRQRELPDGRLKVLVQGLAKARVVEFTQTAPFYMCNVIKISDIDVEEKNVVANALMRNVRDQLEKIIAQGRVLNHDILMILEDVKDAGRMADLVAFNLNLNVLEAQELLEILDPIDRLHRLNNILSREIEILSVQNKIKTNAKDEINRNQKEYYLREQIKAIKNELGETGKEKESPDDEFSELREKIKKANMSEEAEKESNKQLARLEKMHPDSSESAILRSYLEWMTDLPWNLSSQEHIDLDLALNILNEDHFDLHKVKERILEYLAVRQLKGQKMKGPILCFSGPPGVGKTSLGKSIAKACGREFVRISLGGVKDEAEIRGHRRTYVGAMPGRFIQALRQVKTNNPVILLDEVDKMGGDFKGDPSSALLEVLDPEQNSSFRDHYLNVPFDLSNVMFIATSNMLEHIPAPLRDRMEIINLSGYSQEEKVVISKKYIIPKQMDENGISDDNISFSDEGVVSVIKHYTSEAGLRNLERKIGAICRKVAMKIAKGEAEKTHIMSETVYKLLGPPVYTNEDEKEVDEIGVATGLAWTAHGGEVLYIEATKMKGKGLTLTGQLGEVMKESAQTAIGHIRANAESLMIDESFFERNEIHVHLPAGATPKDGPSAGITLATAIVSLITDTPISKDIAMTGEITLTGKVLPIGGLKEKALAAMRMNIKTIIIPWKNKKDLEEISPEYLEKLNIIPVKTLDEVLEIALVGWSEKKKKYQVSFRELAA